MVTRAPRSAASATPATEAMRRLFLHQDGFAIATAFSGLDAAGALEPVLAGRVVSLGDMAAGTASYPAVLAFVRAGESAGWLRVGPGWPGPGTPVSLAAAMAGGAPLTELYVASHRQVADRLRDADWADDDSVVSAAAETLAGLEAARTRVHRSGALTEAERTIAGFHLEGLVAAVVLPRLAARTGEDPPGPAYSSVLRFLGFEDGRNGPTRLGEAGTFFRPVYGLIGSYARSLLAFPDWLRATAPITPARVNDLVDRRLNVLASGAAHKSYFATADQLVRRLFDEAPPAAQPRAIVDVGCGDGSWLRRTYETIVRTTTRGKNLERFPLGLVGVDVDRRALDVARTESAGWPAIFVEGDVGAPRRICSDVAAATGYDPEEVLHVRAFVDHNRRILAESVPGIRPAPAAVSAPVCTDDAGRLVAPEALEESWREHYAGWRAASARHGMVVVEGHVLPPAEILRRRGSVHALAFELYHSLSGQSPLDWPGYQRVVRSAGLRTTTAPSTYPRHHVPATSIQHLVADS
ncbi:class I SAM-dependent methyltransferase [Amycolatopsis sp. cmx-4-83]|uniref:class I SAM-dependent methyltransferase n=1 Tax=Amycolatopsis sp. cmx-4-83 TaxID=2790940 RepID=UPI00397CDAEF